MCIDLLLEVGHKSFIGEGVGNGDRLRQSTAIVIVRFAADAVRGGGSRPVKDFHDLHEIVVEIFEP